MRITNQEGILKPFYREKNKEINLPAADGDVFRFHDALKKTFKTGR